MLEIKDYFSFVTLFSHEARYTLFPKFSMFSVMNFFFYAVEATPFCVHDQDEIPPLFDRLYFKTTK